MTTAQQKKFYFPNWNRACQNQGWIMVKGRLAGERVPCYASPEITEKIYHPIWAAAAALAAQHHRAITPDDLRHACHQLALDADKSSHDLTNPEVDRVVALFRILADPTDIDAVMNYFEPSNAEWNRMVWFLQNRCQAAYVATLCRQRFGTPDFFTLDLAELRQLVMTLKHRPNSQTQPAETPF